jgi:hypothetical protein
VSTRPILDPPPPLKLRWHLVDRLVPAAIEVALVAIAMMDLYLGIGVIIGLGASAISSAIRDHRREQRRHAELIAEVDRQLGAVARRAHFSEEHVS